MPHAAARLATRRPPATPGDPVDRGGCGRDQLGGTAGTSGRLW